MSIKLKVLKENNHIQPDLTLPVGKEVVLQADTSEHERGLVVKWKEDGGYDVYYWYDDPNKVVPAELKADGKLVGDAIKRVYLGYHPELDDTKGAEKLEEKDDRCTRIAKRKYDVWPSAYASGAVVKCRKGKIWKGLKEAGMISEEEEDLVGKITKALRDEGGAAGVDIVIKLTKAKKAEIEDTIEDEEKFVVHTDGDIILKDDSLDEKKQSSEDAGDLRKWFGRKGEKGSKGGWVDCNAPDGDGGYKECAQGKRKKKPYCRPTPSACKTEPKKESKLEELIRQIVSEEDLEEKKKKACKPSKGKRFAKRVDGKCRSYGQAGKAKSGGDRIRPGTAKGDAYCARSAKIKKCKNPPCANALSRKKWKCRGSKSVA